MGCEEVTKGSWAANSSTQQQNLSRECAGYDPYNSADRYERIVLRSDDVIEFDSEHDANRAMSDSAMK